MLHNITEPDVASDNLSYAAESVPISFIRVGAITYQQEIFG